MPIYRHIHKGRKRLISERDLMEWLRQKEGRVAMSARKLFEIGGQWIGRVDGRPSYYRFWYVSGSRTVNRASLKTTDFEEAKRQLAQAAVTNARHDPKHPDEVMLVAVLNHYFENHSDKKPSASPARRAGELVMTFLETECGFGPEVKTSKFTKAMQARFAQWSSERFKHSPSYISRNLSVVAAACRFSAKTIVNRGPAGELFETRLLSAMPEVCYDAKWLAEMTDSPEPSPRDYVPTLEELASLLDMDGSVTLRRYDIIALNTWARPEAVLDLSVREQVDFENGLVDLNPPGRKQTKKRRPTIKLTENLRGWLEHWGEDRPLSYSASGKGKTPACAKRQAASHVKAQFKRRSRRWMLTRNGLTKAEIDSLFRKSRNGQVEHLQQALANAEARGIHRITPYTYRHFMATKVRSLREVRVDREQRSLWLGHGKRDATSWYETLDPEHLHECARATSIIMEKLDAITKRPLVPMSVKQRKLLAGLTAISSQK